MPYPAPSPAARSPEPPSAAVPLPPDGSAATPPETKPAPVVPPSNKDEPRTPVFSTGASPQLSPSERQRRTVSTPAPVIQSMDAAGQSPGTPPPPAAPPASSSGTSYNFVQDAREFTYQKELAGWKRRTDDQAELMVMDPETAFKGVDFSRAPDPLRVRMLVANSTFMDLQGDGSPIPDDESDPRRDIIRARIAHQLFNGRGAASEEEFFAELKTYYQGKRDRKSLAEDLQNQALVSTIVGDAGEKGTTYQAWRDQAKGRPGYDPRLEARYFQAWNETRTRVREHMAPYAKELAEVWTAMKAGGAGSLSQILKKVPGGLPAVLDSKSVPEALENIFLPFRGPKGFSHLLEEIGKQDAGAVAYHIYQKLDDGQRKDFMAGLALLIQTFPREQRRDLIANLNKSGGRVVDDIGRALARPFTADAFEERINRALGNSMGPWAPSPEDRAKNLKRADEIRDKALLKRNFEDDVRKLERGDFDPIAYFSKPSDDTFSWRTAEEGLYAIPGVLAFVGTTVATRGIGTFLVMEDFAYADLRDNARAAGASEINASRFADNSKTLAAIPQTALEMFQVYAPLGKIPAVNRTLKALGDKITNRLLGGIVKVGATGMVETTTEELQHQIPYITQQIVHSLSEDTGIPAAQFMNGKNGAFDGFWKRQAVTFISMLPLAGGSALAGLNEEASHAAFKNATTTQLLAFGGTPEAIEAIHAANGPASLKQAVETFMGSRDPNSPQAAAAVEQLQAQLQSQKAAVAEAKASGDLPDIVQNASGGYTVLDGKTKQEIASAPDIAGAIDIVTTRTTALDEQRAEKISYLASILEAGEEALAMAGDPNASNQFELGTVFTEAMAEAENPQSIDQFRTQAGNRDRVNGGDGGVTRVALGQNASETRGLVRTFTSRLFQGASVQTVVHETGHAMYRRNRDAGTITREETLNFVRAVDSIMGDTTLRRGPNQGEKLALLEAGLTDNQITERMLDEAVQEILEAEILRTRKRGTDEKPLRVSGGVISRNLLALSRLAPEATRKFRALIDAAGGIFGLSSARALRMKQAARQGTFDTTRHEAFLTTLTGSGWQHAQTSQESAAPGSNSPSLSDTTRFSLEDHPAGDGGKRSPATFVAKVWNALASHDELFQYGKTTSADPHEIAKTVSRPGRPITAEVGARHVRFDSDFGYLTVRDTDTDTPYISSPNAGSQGLKGGGGSQLYAAALDWIHNNGKRIKDDPGGLIGISPIRRTSNFLASALRWGTTRHLLPHADQKIEDWNEADSHNLYQLAIAEMRNVHQTIPESRGWTFDFEQGIFKDSDGRQLTAEADFDPIVKRYSPEDSGIGLSTLQRGVLTASALREIRRGTSKETLESMESHLPSVLEGTSYSLGRAQQPRLTPQQIRETEDRAFEHAGRTRIVNTDDFRPLIPGYAEADPLTRDSAYHPTASAITTRVLERMLAGPPVTGKVLVLAGGGGSGKSTALGAFAHDSDVTFDTTFSYPEYAEELRRQIHASGREMEVLYVHRDFNKSFEDIVRRYLNEKAAGNARIVPLPVAVSAHLGAQEVILNLKNTPITIVDNNGSLERLHEIPLGQLAQQSYTHPHEKETNETGNRPRGIEEDSRTSHQGTGRDGQDHRRARSQARLEAEGRAIIESFRAKGRLSDAEARAFLGE